MGFFNLTEKDNIMKTFQLIGAAALALLLCAAGCTTTNDNYRNSESTGAANLSPAEGPKGYVEFFTPKIRSDNGVSIYAVEADQHLRLLGEIGVLAGGRHVAREGDAPVCETLRVAAPPGPGTFMIERGGKTLHLTVVRDMVTRVEVKRVFVDHAINYDVYRVATRVLDPVAPGAITGPAIARTTRPLD